jgi:tetratricopeptide (TPR) repeat protein
VSENSTGALVADLRAQIEAGQVLVIAGAGVAVAATAGGAPDGTRVASWKGLLADGIERCVLVGRPPAAEGWAERLRADLGSADLDDLLSVAERVSSRLGAPAGGDYSRWLRETVGALRASDPSVPRALAELGVTIATTNYDGLLEEVTGQPPVTWRDGARMERVARGDEAAILHLHGHWQDPQSVVLGIRSYERVLGDAPAQAMMRALRTLRTLLFVGCGAGLEDPNFAALLAWSRGVFAGSEYRHFRLCLESEVATLNALHAPEERLFPVPYGREHGDLASFLGGLRAKRSPAAATPAPATATFAAGADPAVPRLPPPRYCFGREDAVTQAVAAVLAKPAAPLAILGPPGVGKTTVAVTALHDPRVVKRYRSRRFFVRADGVSGRDALVAALAATVGLEPGPNLEQRTWRELERGPALLVLDNAETPWDADPQAVEELLAQLAAVPGLALVATVRGDERPAGPRWAEPIRLRPLDPAPARSAFLAVAGERHRSDPDLDPLLEAVDRLPIAIDLLAHQAEPLPGLGELWQRWQSERSAVLQRAGGRTREVNLEVSVELSLQSPRMTRGGERLASMLALLPGGLAPEDVGAVLPEESAAAAAALRRTGLAAPDVVRLRLLAPIREVLRRSRPPQPDDHQRLVAHFLELARLGDRVGAEGGAEAARRLETELGNLEAILAGALEAADPESAIGAVLALGKFERFTGIGSSALLDQAAVAARKAGSVLLEARCLGARADLALARSDHDSARSRYEEALSLFRRVGDVPGEARCIESLGDIALRRSDHNGARSRYEEALPLYRRVGAVLGEANCIQGLGDIALRRSDHDGARSRYEEALPLYRRVGAVLGEANCIKGLGDIALRRSDHDSARSRYEEALPLYRRVGAVLGEANCIQGLGDIALWRSDHDSARSRYEEALPLYRRVGDVLGEANCIQGLGDIALRRSDHDGARSRYEEALPLFRRVGSVLGEANCIKSLGDIALGRSDHDSARSCYEEALPLFRRVGSVLGEANCIKGLGNIALRRSDHDNARSRYEEALPLYRLVGDVLGEANCVLGLGEISTVTGETETARRLIGKALELYERIAEPYSVGRAQRRLAKIAADAASRLEHLEAARRAWSSIGRSDLVADIDRDLGAEGAKPEGSEG